jgi:hypothetical protein
LFDNNLSVYWLILVFSVWDGPKNVFVKILRKLVNPPRTYQGLTVFGLRTTVVDFIIELSFS